MLFPIIHGRKKIFFYSSLTVHLYSINETGDAFLKEKNFFLSDFEPFKIWPEEYMNCITKFVLDKPNLICTWWNYIIIYPRFLSLFHIRILVVSDCYYTCLLQN